MKNFLKAFFMVLGVFVLAIGLVIGLLLYPAGLSCLILGLVFIFLTYDIKRDLDRK